MAGHKPIAGLLHDLKSRGLLEDTLVIWGGEFGRTPTTQGGDGRDHNPEGFTMWTASGGVKGGMAYGASDDYEEVGYFATENKIHIHDFQATILHILGLDHEALTYRYAGRGFRLTDVHGHVGKIFWRELGGKFKSFHSPFKYVESRSSSRSCLPDVLFKESPPVGLMKRCRLQSVSSAMAFFRAACFCFSSMSLSFW
jgi:hypothetical protein